MSGATPRELRLQATEKLRAAGVESPETDARILLGLATGLDEAALVSASRIPISDEQRKNFAGFVERRIGGEPVSRIAGYREFWSRRFRLGSETLVPRPETETLVEAALAVFPERDAALRVLDLGTGSGILLAAILLERLAARGVGIDRSEAALKVARGNLDALGAGDRAQLICGDWSAALGRKFDLVVSNPPYIASRDIPALSREVREHDPKLALDGGVDGLDSYRKIIAELPQLLSPEGVSILELGAGQEEAVAALARAEGLRAGPAQRDLAGVPRALIVYPRT